MTLTMCPRCKCCSVFFRGACVGRCDLDGHTADSIERARLAEYERQIPLRRAAKELLGEAEDEYYTTITRLDKEYDDAWKGDTTNV